MAAGLLFVLVLVSPYRGFVHDARLYDLQVLNRVTAGQFDNDLFLAYGSQDSYSLFSFCIAPLARAVGVSAAFFIAYLITLALLLYAEVLLVRQLISSRTLGNLALVLLSVSMLTYSSGNTFRVHEAFLTARLPAVACAVLGLVWSLERRWWRSFAALGVALAFHPLMAVGAFAVAAGLLIFGRIPTHILAAIVPAILAAAAAFLLSPIPDRFLTRMSSEWMEVVRIRSPHCVLSSWDGADWVRMLFPMLLMALRYPRANDIQKRFIVLLLGVAAGGMIVNGLAEYGRFALLLQGQGYRALWMVSLVGVPMGVQVIRDYWRRDTTASTVAATVLLAGLGETLLLDRHAAELWPTICLLWVLFTGAVLVVRSKKSGDRVSRVRTACLWGLTIALVVFSVRFTYSVARVTVGKETDPRLIAAAVLEGPSELALFLPAVWLLSRAVRSSRDVVRAGVGLAAAAVILSAGVFALSERSIYRSRFVRGYASVDLVRDVTSREGPRDAQIYWTIEPPLIWNDVGANCYFHVVQTAGVIFSPETAAEGIRRGRLVKPFEIAQMRRESMNPIGWERELTALEGSLDEPPPTVHDLLALAADESLDWLVLYEEFPGFYAATDGLVFIYDCRELRRTSPAAEVAYSK